MHYTKIIEEKLTKKQILETYLNAVYFGFNAYGIDAAAETYFGKDPRDLDLTECVALAALPQSPDTYALVKASYTASETDLPVIDKGDGLVYLYNGGATEERRKIILSNMEEAGHITAAQKKAALAESLEDRINIDTKEQPAGYTYYIDCAIDEAVGDVAEKFGISEDEARTMVYTGKEVLGRMFNVLGEPIDDKPAIETELKAAIHRAAPAFEEEKSVVILLVHSFEINGYVFGFSPPGFYRNPVSCLCTA